MTPKSVSPTTIAAKQNTGQRTQGTLTCSIGNNLIYGKDRVYDMRAVTIVVLNIVRLKALLHNFCELSFKN